MGEFWQTAMEEEDRGEKYEFSVCLLIFHISVIKSMMEILWWLEAVYSLMPLIILLTGDSGL